MKTTERNTLEGYVRHAEHYGTNEVFETALDEGLGLRDLGKLSLRLQNLNPKWKLTVDNQRLFVLALVGHGHQDVRGAARMAGCTLATARTWTAEPPEDGEGEPDLALRRASKERFELLRGIVRGWHRTS